jgi:excisionase family DNA binding protein
MYLTPAQAAKILNCHPRTVNRLCKSKRLPALNLGVGKHDEWRIDSRDLDMLKNPKPVLPTHSKTHRRRRSTADLPRLNLGP